eukprot:1140490-Pelagomonas_calceolata.AAC.3
MSGNKGALHFSLAYKNCSSKPRHTWPIVLPVSDNAACFAYWLVQGPHKQTAVSSFQAHVLSWMQIVITCVIKMPEEGDGGLKWGYFSNVPRTRCPLLALFKLSTKM